MKKQWMTAFGLIGMIAAIIWACHKEQPVTITPAEQQLSLVSPEGYALAGSVAELKTQLAEDVSKRLDKTIAPADVTIHDIQYMGDERVRAASILFSFPDGASSALRVLHVKQGMTFEKEGNALIFREISDAEVMSVASPEVPPDLLCVEEIGCKGLNVACHWIYDPDEECLGHHYPSGPPTILFVCDCGCEREGNPSPPIVERCIVL